LNEKRGSLWSVDSSTPHHVTVIGNTTCTIEVLDYCLNRSSSEFNLLKFGPREIKYD